MGAQEKRRVPSSAHDDGENGRKRDNFNGDTQRDRTKIG